MTREYFFGRRHMADIDSNVNAEDYLARTVYEDYAFFDISVLDASGDPIMAARKWTRLGL